MNSLRKVSLLVAFFLSLFCHALFARTSITDEMSYRSFCMQASKDENYFRQFKRFPPMVSVMQHVSQRQGQEMLDHIYRYSPDLLDYFDEFRQNDLVGNPIVYEYPPVGSFSPTNLRYIKIAGEIINYIGDLEGKTIVEIGGGYGGQCKILSDLFEYKEYILVDLPEVLALAKKYLDQFGIKNVRYLTMDQLPENLTSDLVISNYAFSECSLEVQEIYFKQVSAQASSGFLVCNQIFGILNTPPLCPEEMSLKIKGLGRNSQIMPEMPQTAFDNYLVVWHDIAQSEIESIRALYFE